MAVLEEDEEEGETGEQLSDVVGPVPVLAGGLGGHVPVELVEGEHDEDETTL